MCELPGEIEVSGDGIGGLVVHIAARVVDAEPKSGVPGEWQLYTVSRLP